MTRAQVRFPDPLYRRLKKVAEKRDWSFAEVLRCAAEAYLLTIAEDGEGEAEDWTLPVLKPSGGYIQDPAEVRVEADVVVEKLMGTNGK